MTDQRDHAQRPSMRAALEPFARLGAPDCWPDHPNEFVVCSFRDTQVTIGDLRKANAALAAQPPAAPVDMGTAMEVFDHAYTRVLEKSGDARKAEIAGVHAAIDVAYDIMTPPVQPSSAATEQAFETYRETVKNLAAAREKGYAAARANLQEAWSALAMIREAVETLAPSGSVKAAEHLDGPTFMHEAEALVAGIQAISSGPQAPSKLLTMLAILDAAGGVASASDSKWCWFNYFCDDVEPIDTFNQAIDAKFIRVGHDDRFDSSTAYLTDAGRAALAVTRPDPKGQRCP